MDEFETVKKEYYDTLAKLAENSKQTIEELDKEISDAVKNGRKIEDIMVNASEIFDE